jgi:hypothetical protein
MAHPSTYPTYQDATLDWKAWGEPTLIAAIEAVPGLKIDRERFSQRDGALSVITEDDICVPIEIHAKKAPSSSRFRSDYAVREFSWKVDPRYGESSNLPRKVKVGADGNIQTEAILTAILEKILILRAQRDSVMANQLRQNLLEKALLAKGYIKGSTYADSELAAYAVNGYHERRQDSPVFFYIGRGATAKLTFFRDGLRHDVDAGLDENSPEGFFISKVTVSVMPKGDSLMAVLPVF